MTKPLQGCDKTVWNEEPDIRAQVVAAFGGVDRIACRTMTDERVGYSCARGEHGLGVLELLPNGRIPVYRWEVLRDLPVISSGHESRRIATNHPSSKFQY